MEQQEGDEEADEEAEEEAEENTEEEAEPATSRALASLRQSPVNRPFLASQQQGVKQVQHPTDIERPVLLSKSKGWSSIRESFSLPPAPPARKRSDRRRSHQRRLNFEEAGGQEETWTWRNSSVVEDKGRTRTSSSIYPHSSNARQTDVVAIMGIEKPMIPARPAKFEGKGLPRGKTIGASSIEKSKSGRGLTEIEINLMVSQASNGVDKVV